MCEQAAKLLRNSNEAALEFSKTLLQRLEAQERTSTDSDYASLRKVVELVRKESVRTHQALEDHLREHGCETLSAVSNNTGGSRRAPADYEFA